MLLTLRHDCHELRDGESLGLDECLGLRDVGAKLLREHGRINFGQQIWKKELLFLFNYKNHIHIHSMNSMFLLSFFLIIYFLPVMALDSAIFMRVRRSAGPTIVDTVAASKNLPWMAPTYFGPYRSACRVHNDKLLHNFFYRKNINKVDSL